MNAFDYQEAWGTKPRKLTIEEIEQPEKVIEEFFQFAQLPEVRILLWEVMKTMVTGNFAQLRVRERSKMMFFYEQIEKLIEGVHVLHVKTSSEHV